MCKNVGDLDSGIRVVIGTIIFILGVLYQSWWSLLGLIPFLTGIFHYCPLYSLFKWNTTCRCCTEKPVTKKKKK